jgi:hypothetical protein
MTQKLQWKETKIWKKSLCQKRDQFTLSKTKTFLVIPQKGERYVYFEF